jgi:hypothetical protein
MKSCNRKKHHRHEIPGRNLNPAEASRLCQKKNGGSKGEGAAQEQVSNALI